MSHDHNHDKMHKKVQERMGSKIDHGALHTREHQESSRRNFMKNSGLFAVGSVMLGATGINILNPTAEMMSMLTSDCGDRILVLIRLDGGNDGLNTVVPITNDEYYNIRPNIAVTPANCWKLSNSFGMPKTMTDLESMWGDGKMKVVHNVGYPEQNYSHFRSSDIWASSSDSETVVNSGWIGRMIESNYEAFQNAPPTVPPALEIGVQTNLLFRGSQGAMALSVSNPTEFYQIASTGQLYNPTPADNSEHEKELSFMRTVANSAYRYSESIKEAYTTGRNKVQYPEDSYLAEQMSIIARLIKGKLGTKVYMVSIGGFDTHANQLNDHPRLVTQLSKCVKAFFEDISEAGLGPNVLAMTFSEFGRTIFENGSEGTDHGTAAPVLMFGEGLQGNGFVGTPPDLVNVDQYGDPLFNVDFRSVYATVLQDWLCVPSSTTEFVLGNAIQKKTGILPPSSPNTGLNGDDALLGHNPGINGGIDIKYSITAKGPTKILLMNQAGSLVRTFYDGFSESGSFIFNFNPGAYLIQPGNYVYQLQTGGRVYSRKIKIQ